MSKIRAGIHSVQIGRLRMFRLHQDLNGMSFEKWMSYVNQQCVKKGGISLHNIPNWDETIVYMFDRGLTPSEAATELLVPYFEDSHDFND